ncbi:hypothetical protein H4S04_008327 [Coemansia sp. S16]|nr:hypothetical protein H4S04_008327 [Coemansia sp. S16]
MLSTLATNYQLLVELPAAQNFCALIGLPRLVPYWPALLAFAGLFQLLRLSSNTLSSLVFGAKFDSLTPRQKYDWGVRVVSQVHAIVVVVLAIPIFFKQELINDKLFGFDNYAAWVYTLVCGYSINKALELHMLARVLDNLLAVSIADINMCICVPCDALGLTFALCM